MFFQKIKPSKNSIFAAVMSLLAISAWPAFADINGLTNRPLATIINSITEWLLGIAAAIAVLFIIIGGLYYITSGGDEKRIETAKSTITYAILGIFVVSIAYAAVVLANKLIGG